MITRYEDRQIERKDNFKGGEGYLVNRVILPADGMYGKGRIFNTVTLEKNCEIGWHVHDGDGETYLVISGEGEYNDNGTVTTLRAGDVSFTDSGEQHGIINKGTEPLVLIGLILNK